MSSDSIELRWTDWHLKPEESIPDDRYYSVRYCVAQSDSSSSSSSEINNVNNHHETVYKFKNSTERSVIVNDLIAGTLYDFSVKLVIGTRESDWSMTTSQMTMEAGEIFDKIRCLLIETYLWFCDYFQLFNYILKAPAPRSIRIKSDPNSPTTVILTWMAPKQTNSGGKSKMILYKHLKLKSSKT